MTERLIWRPENPDDEPIASIETPRGDYELGRENSALFTFMGKLALYDHIYYCDVQEQEVNESFYVFSFAKGFKKLAKYMMENSFSAHLNMTEVGSGDVEAYLQASLADLRKADHVPDWF